MELGKGSNTGILSMFARDCLLLLILREILVMITMAWIDTDMCEQARCRKVEDGIIVLSRNNKRLKMR